MTRQTVSIVLLASAAFLTGCQGFAPYDAEKAATVAELSRDQGYSLLYSTIDNDSDVDKILIIKGPSPQVAELIKVIAQFCRSSREQLKAFAKADSTLRLDNQGLPEAETSTREAISSATSKQVVFSGGKEFEFRILLTQHGALNYITHLAGTLSRQETLEARKLYLSQLAEESKALHERVIGLLQAPYVSQSK